jgi:hypothetical protein
MQTAVTIRSVTSNISRKQVEIGVTPLSAQLLLFVIAEYKFHYFCFHVTFSLKITNIVSVSLT